MKKVISKVRINKANKQKTINVPKQEETKDWEEGDFIEMIKLKI